MNLMVSAPSGSGKTTLLSALFNKYSNTFGFSISATTRKPRLQEKDGIDYYFLSKQDFEKKIAENAFLEYVQVYEGMYYGTLRSEIQRIENLNLIPVFDVDVEGAMDIKESLGANVYSVFIMPPDLDTLRKRLTLRASDTIDSINKRLQRADKEISFASRFDKIIINDNLDKAKKDFFSVVEKEVLNR